MLVFKINLTRQTEKLVFHIPQDMRKENYAGYGRWYVEAEDATRHEKGCCIYWQSKGRTKFH